MIKKKALMMKRRRVWELMNKFIKLIRVYLEVMLFFIHLFNKLI